MSRKINNFEEKAKALKALVARVVEESETTKLFDQQPEADLLTSSLRYSDALYVLAELLDPPFIAKPYFIEAELGRDEPHTDQLPRYIGPFDSAESATSYIEAQGPLWGSWSTIRAIAPGETDWKGNRA